MSKEELTIEEIEGMIIDVLLDYKRVKGGVHATDLEIQCLGRYERIYFPITEGHALDKWHECFITAFANLEYNGEILVKEIYNRKYKELTHEDTLVYME